MKKIIISSLVLLSSNTFAQMMKKETDLAELHEKFCESKEVESIKGESDSCRIGISITPKKEVGGYCTGELDFSLPTPEGKFMPLPVLAPCIVTYASIPEGSAAEVQCMFTGMPIVNSFNVAKINDYLISAVIEKESGEVEVVHDERKYFTVENETLELAITEQEIDGKIVRKTNSLKITLGVTQMPLKNIKCF